MKKTIVVLLFASFAVLLFVGCRRHNTYVTVSENNDELRLEAFFDRRKQSAVEEYLNRSLSPNASLHGNYNDVETSLDDHTFFHIKSTPGELRIRFNKHEGSSDSYARVKKMCKGISQVINH